MKLSFPRHRPVNGTFPILVALAAALLLALAAVPAFASPEISTKQAEVDRLKGEIASINVSAEQAIERYNQANSELESTRQQMVETQKSVDEANTRLNEARTRLSKRLQGIYRGGQLNFIDVILSTSSFSEFITRFDLLGRIGNQDRTDIDDVIQYKSELEKAKTDLQNTNKLQEELLASVAAEKSAVETQLAARQSVLSSAEGEVARMLAEQMQREQAAAAGPPTPSAGAAAPGPSAPGPVAGPPPNGQPAPPPVSGGVVPIAMQYLGVPYVWGGASPTGFDCSGLVMYVYAQIGVYLPHSAAAQYYSGTPISFSELAPGDLVFFGSPISHVGIYIGGGSMIHAPFEGAVVSITGISGGGSYAGACRL
ncbi:MAG: C40 family peptidase [Thermoleophilia bacterium]